MLLGERERDTRTVKEHEHKRWSVRKARGLGVTEVVEGRAGRGRGGGGFRAARFALGKKKLTSLAPVARASALGGAPTASVKTCGFPRKPAFKQ